ncbi:MAG: hypothetical protein GIW95_06870 [Candidatus Eremiobacteraeota bacterium]|nr:hypothetical protein [Candidatus Eremiobacteraeota bacterium]
MTGSAALAAALLVLSIEPPQPAPTAAVATPQATSTPKAALREIGRIRAQTPFCRAFTDHFNASARTMLGNDDEISYVDFTFGSIENHFKARAGELLFYDDRVKLIAYVKALQTALPGLQAEINALRKSAALTTDPENAKAARDVAAQLQKSYDRQRQIAIDSLGVIHAMMDYSIGNTKASTSIQTNVPGGYDEYLQTTPPERRDVRSYLKLHQQMDRIGDAEAAAAITAETVAERC